jgi:hypothetical protein
MGEYEPDDSRDVTLSDHQAPGEPERTGPREGEARRKAYQDEAQQGGGGAERAPGEPPRHDEVAAKDAQDARREGGPARET